MPIVLNISAENFVTHVVFITRPKISRQNRGAGLIRQEVDECAARRIDVRRPRSCAVVSCHLRDEPCRESTITIDSVDCNDVILLGEESETELEAVIAARDESIIINLKNLIPQILVCRSPKLDRLCYSRAGQKNQRHT